MSFERELFDELNELRADPQKYANKVKKYLSYFEGKVLNIPGRTAYGYKWKYKAIRRIYSF